MSTFLSGVDSLMSYSTMLLSEAQLPRSSVCGKTNPVALNECVSQNTDKLLRANGSNVADTCLGLYLHRVEADRAEAVYTPRERTDWATSLLVPDVHLLATRCKHTFFLVMVQSCKHGLQRTRGLYIMVLCSDTSWIDDSTADAPWSYLAQDSV